MKIPIGHGVLAAIETGYLEPHQWQDWADRRLVKDIEPEDWIADLSLAESVDEARSALQPILRREELVQGSLISTDEVELGLLYKMFERGDFDLQSLLGLAARYDEDEFNYWLVQLESDEEVLPEEIFAPYCPHAAPVIEVICRGE